MDFPALIAFLAALALHNDKPWFAEHRPTYERLRGDWLAFVGQVSAGIAQFDPSVGVVSPKDVSKPLRRPTAYEGRQRARHRKKAGPIVDTLCAAGGAAGAS